MRGHVARKGNRYDAVIYEGVDQITGRQRHRRRNVEIHVKPRIGSIPLQRLTPEDLDSFYADLMVDGRRNGAGGGLSPRTVRIIHGMLRKALANACRKGTLLRNVADLADPPKPSAYGRKELRIWNAAQLRQFLDEVSDHRLHPAFFLAANTEPRRGEVLGLRWDDLDLETARLSVRHAVLTSPTSSSSPT